MPENYSKDLRWRVICLQKKSVKAEMYVGERTVARYINLYNSTGDISPKKQHHGPLPSMSEFELVTILQRNLVHISMNCKRNLQK